MKVGVLGSIVWDCIDYVDGPRVERWGGISYSLSAAAAAAPADWSLRPIVKIGRDRIDGARAFLDTLPDLDRSGSVVPVDAPNNQVHLQYVDRHHRNEILTGGVPPWQWSELEPHVHGLDALFINLISGFELQLDTVERLRASFDGPMYVDLHSLLLAVGKDGQRTPRLLLHRDRWLGAFDIVQMNEWEAQLLAGPQDAWSVAARAVAEGTAAVLVTRGPRGATWTAPADVPWPWRYDRSRTGEEADPPVRRQHVPVGRTVSGDPTGCGDVWGATCFMALLKGERLSDAMRAAHQAAVRNLGHRGADGLYAHLKGGT